MKRGCLSVGIWIFLFFSILNVIIILYEVKAINCWEYDSSGKEICEANGCKWNTDSWGDGWCEQLDCWSFWTNDSCLSAVTTYNLSCRWQSGGTMSGWCNEIGCWIYDGTNQTTCENTSKNFGLSCEWSGVEDSYSCMGGMQCMGQRTRASCVNISGCTWGMCYEKGCWSYMTQETCNAQSNCVWNNNGWCEEDNCWSSKYNTKQACENTSNTLKCKWNTEYGGYCEQLSCYSYNFNQTGCTDPNINGGLDCSWDSISSMCMEKGCWSYSDENSCNGKVANGKNCTWQVSQMQNTGWCEKIGCWSFDLWHNSSANEAGCINNSYNLDCVWDNSTGDGWCYQDIVALSCSNLTDQRKCWDTMWCYWDDNTDTCNDPNVTSLQGGAIGGPGGGTNFKAPPCSVFYLNDTNCNATLGCYYNNTLNGISKCVSNSTILAALPDKSLKS
jgi:hypothetical protein